MKRTVTCVRMGGTRQKATEQVQGPGSQRRERHIRTGRIQGTGGGVRARVGDGLIQESIWTGVDAKTVQRRQVQRCGAVEHRERGKRRRTK